MADLNDIAIFVKVAQLGSFSNAAQSLGMPISTVSRRITALAEELGATLLQRTTRKLTLTAECSEPLNILSDAERANQKGNPSSAHAKMDFAYDGWLIECTDELAKRGTKSAVREITIHPEEFSDWSRTSGQNPSLAMLGTFALAKSRGKE